MYLAVSGARLLCFIEIRKHISTTTASQQPAVSPGADGYNTHKCLIKKENGQGRTRGSYRKRRRQRVIWAENEKCLSHTCSKNTSGIKEIWLAIGDRISLFLLYFFFVYISELFMLIFKSLNFIEVSKCFSYNSVI